MKVNHGMIFRIDILHSEWFTWSTIIPSCMGLLGKLYIKSHDKEPLVPKILRSKLKIKRYGTILWVSPVSGIFCTCHKGSPYTSFSSHFNLLYQWNRVRNCPGEGPQILGTPWRRFSFLFLGNDSINNGRHTTLSPITTTDSHFWGPCQ